MKKLLTAGMAAAISLSAAAQMNSIPNSGGDNDETGLIQTVFNIKEKTDKFHLYLNTQTNLNMSWSGEGEQSFDGGKFAFKQLRIEFKGNVNDWLSYRYRQRLNKGQSEMGYFDNILKCIDIAEVGFRYKKVNFVVGKQCASYGGIEFDLNPIEVYQYCDMIEYMDNFMTGVRGVWDINDNQQLQLQVLDGVALNPGEMYGENVAKAKLPFLYTVNWNGNFNGVYSTRWSASFMNEVKNRHMWYFAMGNKFDFTPQWGAWIDAMYSREGIDRKGIITNVVGVQDVKEVDGKTIGRNAFNTEYLTLLLHMNYFVHPKWNIFGKVAWEQNGVYKESAGVKKGNYGTDWLYVGGVEFYPLKDRGLHFFLTYIGQTITHSKMAQETYKAVPNYHTNMLTAGFIWQIPLF